MKSKILGLLAGGLLAGPMAAHAVIFDVTLTRTSDSSTWSGSFEAPDVGGTVSAMSIVVDGKTFNYPKDLSYSPNFLNGFLYSGAFPNLTGGLQFLSSGLWASFDCTPTLGGGLACGKATAQGDYRVSRAVPEPGTLALLGLGLAGLGLSRRRRAD